MSFSEKIKQHGQTVESRKAITLTEEASKTAFILPFLQILGYDVFNPNEVVPEFIADIGTKKGEKVDYGILKDSQPFLIIECKHYTQKLVAHNTQLVRYFHTTPAKFALITNGINYEFFTDIDESNKMDAKPFLTFDITKIRDAQIDELEKFHKSNIEDLDAIYDSAADLKYSNEIKAILRTELQEEPSDEFIKFFASRVYPGKRITAGILEQFSFIVKKASKQLVGEMVNDRLTAALNKEKELLELEAEQIESQAENEPVVKRGVETTEEEIQAYYIVKSIVSEVMPLESVHYRDAKSYFSILFEDNNRKPLCRLYLNSETTRYIGIFNETKDEIKYPIESIDEVYKYRPKLQEIAKYYAEELSK